MTTTDTFHVTQHDRGILEDKATELTGLPATAGDTRLAFLATLTPVRSGPVFFSMHSDGYIEDMSAPCANCGRQVNGGEVTGRLTGRESVETLMALASGPRAGALARLMRRTFTGCKVCDIRNRHRLIDEKWSSRPDDFTDHDDQEG